MYAAPAVGAAVAALTSGWTRRVHRHGRAVAVAAAGWGVAIVVFGLVDALWLALACLAVAGAMDSISGLFRSTMWNETIPTNLRGRLAGIEMLSWSSGPTLGGAEAGAVASLAGVRASVVSGGVLCVAGTAALVFVLPRFWQLRRPDRGGRRRRRRRRGRGRHPSPGARPGADAAVIRSRPRLRTTFDRRPPRRGRGHRDEDHNRRRPAASWTSNDDASIHVSEGHPRPAAPDGRQAGRTNGRAAALGRQTGRQVRRRRTGGGGWGNRGTGARHRREPRRRVRRAIQREHRRQVQRLDRLLGAARERRLRRAARGELDPRADEVRRQRRPIRPRTTSPVVGEQPRNPARR